MSGTITLMRPDDDEYVPEFLRWLGLGPRDFYTKDGYYVTLVDITPEMARRLLAPEVAHSNRNRSPTFVSQFADDMLAGMWAPYCSTISGAGVVVVDGQTRLEAVVTSGRTEKFIVLVRPEDDPGIYDQQHKRRFDEAEAMRMTTLANIPRRHSSPIATGLAIHYRWAGMSEEHFRITSDQQKGNLLHADPDLSIALNDARAAFRHEAHIPLTPAATAGFAACIVHQRAMGMAFLEAFMEAAKHGEGHPAYKLFHWLQDHRAERTRVYSYYNAVIYCYDAFCSGRQVKNVTIQHDRFERPRGAR
jgi:hypothetical protein